MADWSTIDAEKARVVRVGPASKSTDLKFWLLAHSKKPLNGSSPIATGDISDLPENLLLGVFENKNTRPDGFSTAGISSNRPDKEKIASAAPELGVWYFSNLAVTASTTIRSALDLSASKSSRSSRVEIERDDPSIPAKLPSALMT